MFFYIFKYKKFAYIFLFIFALFIAPTKADANKIIYIPLDNRPVCLDYIVNSIKSSGHTVATPPIEFIATHDSSGNPDALWQWLLKNAKDSKAAVISTDSLIYGGLVPSRRHTLDQKVIDARVNRLKELKTKFPQLKLYCFSSLLRTPRESYGGVEPDYYEEYGPDFFRLGELLDKNEVHGYDALDQIEIKNITELMPEEYYNDWFSRREKNMKAHFQLVNLTRAKYFHYYAVGKDDNAPLSQTHLEARKLTEYAQGVSSAIFQIIPGIDQIASLLLVRAINEFDWYQPYIYARYADGTGASTIPLYSDQTIGESVEAQILAVGGLPTSEIDKADLILVVNTPFNGITMEATHPQNLSFISDRERKLACDIKDLLAKNKPLTLADVAYANGADNGFMKELYQENLIYTLTAYAGWNTADNSIGSALAQGLLAKKQSIESKKRFLQVRLIDDWYYQANIKTQIIENLTMENINIYKISDQKTKVSKWLQYYMTDFNKEYYGLDIKKYYVSMPWHRLFEIYAEVE